VSNENNTFSTQSAARESHCDERAFYAAHTTTSRFCSLAERHLNLSRHTTPRCSFLFAHQRSECVNCRGRLRLRVSRPICVCVCVLDAHHRVYLPVPCLFQSSEITMNPARL
jgi:hypothetical protein